MTALRIASQLPAALNAALADIGGIEVRAITPGVAGLTAGPEVLLAAPFASAGEPLPARPTGWPFDLRWVQLISVGIDFYPDWLFDGPIVTAAKGTSAVALAEFALAAIFAQAKRMPEIWIHDAASWAQSPLGMVSGSTLGILGFGAIGEALAPRAQALGMRVIATRRSDAPLGPNVERAADPAALFAAADHLVLAAPATAETERMVDARLLAAARPGLHLINVARGLLIDDAALLAALDAGQISRATLDTTYPEPLPAGHAFYKHPRVHLSPHISVLTSDTRRNLVAAFAANVDRYRRGVPLAGVVDRARGY